MNCEIHSIWYLGLWLNHNTFNPYSEDRDQREEEQEEEIGKIATTNQVF
jgi:hypothetical protein